MTLPEIASDIAQMYGTPTYALAPAGIQARILIDVNKAIQELQSAGEDFFTKEDITVILLSETEQYVLPKGVQAVLGPARLDDGAALTELTSRAQLQRFAQIFLGQNGADAPPGRPLAYFVESKRDAADATGDNVTIIVHLVPKPLLTSFSNGAVNLLLNVIKQPSQVTAGQLASGPARLEVPHKYVESVFLPLARYNASGSYFFYAKDKKPQIDEEYKRALQVLGKADPRRPKPADSNSAALEPQGRQAAA